MEKSRPIRNRRHSRRVWSHERPIKRLFTPEIKKMLKDWLVRRRENPYPSRDEKKTLAKEAGLTYTQICNWFANWRRKLKNSSKERNKKTWGSLIKNYNTSAKGNVEQFSISSNDSIWGEEGQNGGYPESIESKKQNKRSKNVKPRFDYFADDNNIYVSTEIKQLYHSVQVESLDFKDAKMEEPSKCGYFASSKFKNHIMEKYLKCMEGTHQHDGNNNYFNLSSQTSEYAPEISKWIQSAANFVPSKSSYIEWNQHKKNDASVHQKEEIEAAEVLTKLAMNFKSRFDYSFTKCNNCD